MHSRNEDGAKVVHIGQRRPGHERVAQRAEETVSIVSRQAVGRTNTLRPGARERVGRKMRPGDLLDAVYAVGVRCDP